MIGHVLLQALVLTRFDNNSCQISEMKLPMWRQKAERYLPFRELGRLVDLYDD